MRMITEEEWGQIGNQFRPLSPEEEQYYQLAERANQLNKGTLGDAFALNPAGIMDAEMVPPSLEEAQRNAMLSRKSTLQPFDLPDWMENILPGLQEAGPNWVGGIDYALTGDSDRAELRAVGKQMRGLAQSGLEGYSPRIQSIAESVATSLPAGLVGGGVTGLATKLGASTALAGKVSTAATTGLLSWIYGTSSYWDTYSRATQSGMDEEAADAAAMFNTMAEIGPMTVLSAIGMGGAEKAIAGQALSGPAARSLSGAIGHGLTAVGKTILEEELEELTTTLLQQFGDAFSGLEPDAMKPENLIPALYETAVQTAVATAIMAAPGGYTGARDAAQRGVRQDAQLASNKEDADFRAVLGNLGAQQLGDATDLVLGDRALAESVAQGDPSAAVPPGMMQQPAPVPQQAAPVDAETQAIQEFLANREQADVQNVPQGTPEQQEVPVATTDNAEVQLPVVPEGQAAAQAPAQEAVAVEQLREMDAGVKEGVTVGQHSDTVLKNMEESGGFQAINKESPRIGSLLRDVALLHDIGKGIAVKKGKKSNQHKETLPILRRELAKKGYSEQEIRVAEALVDNDAIGYLIRGRIEAKDALGVITAQAEKAGMSPQEFLGLQKELYKADAGAYPSLRDTLFKKDSESELRIASLEFAILEEMVHGQSIDYARLRRDGASQSQRGGEKVSGGVPQGFFHGTAESFTEFDPTRDSGTNTVGPGGYLLAEPDLDIAEHYTKRALAKVLSIFSKNDREAFGKATKAQLQNALTNAQEFLRKAQKSGKGADKWSAYVNILQKALDGRIGAKVLEVAFSPKYTLDLGSYESRGRVLTQQEREGILRFIPDPKVRERARQETAGKERGFDFYYALGSALTGKKATGARSMAANGAAVNGLLKYIGYDSISFVHPKGHYTRPYNVMVALDVKGLKVAGEAKADAKPAPSVSPNAKSDTQTDSLVTGEPQTTQQDTAVPEIPEVDYAAMLAGQGKTVKTASRDDFAAALGVKKTELPAELRTKEQRQVVVYQLAALQPERPAPKKGKGKQAKAEAEPAPYVADPIFNPEDVGHPQLQQKPKAEVEAATQQEAQPVAAKPIPGTGGETGAAHFNIPSTKKGKSPIAKWLNFYWGLDGTMPSEALDDARRNKSGTVNSLLSTMMAHYGDKGRAMNKLPKADRPAVNEAWNRFDRGDVEAIAEIPAELRPLAEQLRADKDTLTGLIIENKGNLSDITAEGFIDNMGKYNTRVYRVHHEKRYGKTVPVQQPQIVEAARQRLTDDITDAAVYSTMGIKGMRDTAEKSGVALPAKQVIKDQLPTGPQLSKMLADSIKEHNLPMPDKGMKKAARDAQMMRTLRAHGFELPHVQEGRRLHGMAMARTLRNAGVDLGADTRAAIEKALANDRVQAEINALLKGKKDRTDIYKHRTDIPVEIRRLMGEYTDVDSRHLYSIYYMTKAVGDAVYNRTLLEADGGKWFATKPQRNADGDMLDTRVTLGGETYYTTDEVAKNIEYEADKGVKLPAWSWYRMFHILNANAKSMATVHSLQTGQRNAMSGIWFTFNRGHVNPFRMARTIGEPGKYFNAQTGIDRSPEARARLEFYYQNNITGNNLAVGDVTASAQRAAQQDIPDEVARQGHMLLGYGKAYDAFRKAYYVFGDDIWKVWNYHMDLDFLQRNKPGQTQAWYQKESARRLRMTYQNYSEAFRGARHISTKMPFGSFVLFPAEIIRTQANMARLMAEDMKDSQLRKTVPVRAASMLASVAAADVAAQVLNRMFSGVDDEEEEAFRKTLPSYQQNSTLLFLGKNKNGSWKYVDLGYANPFNLITNTVRAGMRADNPAEAAKAVVQEALSPILSYQLALGKLVEAGSGRTEWGRELYRDTDSVPAKIGKGAAHVGTSQVPQDMYRLFNAVMRDRAQDVNRFGVYRTTPEQVGAELTGFKATNAFPEQNIRNSTFNFKGVVSADKRDVGNLLKNRRLVDDAQLRKTYQAAVRNQRKAIDKFREDVIDTARVLKVDESVIRDELARGGMSKRDITTIMNGGYPPITFSKNDVKDVLADLNKYPRDRGATVEDINRRLSILQEEQQRAVSRQLRAGV